MESKASEYAGITTRERINVSNTSTGNFSAETTCEVTSFVSWEEVEAVAGDGATGLSGIKDAYEANRLEQLGLTAEAEIARRKQRKAASE